MLFGKIMCCDRGKGVPKVQKTVRTGGETRDNHGAATRYATAGSRGRCENALWKAAVSWV